MNIFGNSFAFDWEVQLIIWLQQLLGPTGIQIISFFSFFAETIVFVAIFGLFYWCLDKKFGKQLACIILMGTIWNPMIKNIFDRRRPYMDHPSIDLHRPIDSSSDINNIHAQGFSFPSGHSTNVVCLFVGLSNYKKEKKYFYLALLIAFLVGLSRVVVGAHYPSDVIAGWALGFITLFIVTYLRKKIEKDWIYYSILILSGLPGLFYCTSNDYFTCFGMLIGFCLGSLIESKYINFKETRQPLQILLRFIGGIAIFLILNTLLKMPFTTTFLESGVYLARIVRLLRYAITIFVIVGLYPYLFQFFPSKKQEK